MTPLGLSIASHSGLPPARIGGLAAAAEQAGFGAVFVAEGHGDALAMCHPVAAATSKVQVGTAIANAALRPPVLAAKTAVQLDHASNGRFVLGLGTANAIMNGRFGIAPFAPLKMIEEYVAVVRAVLVGDIGGFTGDVFRTGMVPLDGPVVRADLPVYLGALGPRMLALAGRIADGVILNLMSPARPARRPRSCGRPRGRPGVIHRPCRSRAWCTCACPTTPRWPLPPRSPWSRDMCCTRQFQHFSGRVLGWSKRGLARSPGTAQEPPSGFRRRSPTDSLPTGTPPRASRGSRNTEQPASTCRSCSRCPSAPLAGTTSPSSPASPTPG